MQTLERRARPDAQFLVEPPPGPPEQVQRLALPARAVEREHQQLAEPLALGVEGDEPAQLRDRPGLVADRQQGADQVLADGEPAFVEEGRRTPYAQAVARVEEGGAAPDVEGALEEFQRAFGPGPQVRGALGGQFEESVAVHVLRGQFEEVAVVDPAQHGAAAPACGRLDGPAQPGHGRLQRVAGVADGGPGPQFVDEVLAGDGPPRLQGEGGEQCSHLVGSNGAYLPLVVHENGAQNLDAQATPPVCCETESAQRASSDAPFERPVIQPRRSAAVRRWQRCLNQELWLEFFSRPGSCHPSLDGFLHYTAGCPGPPGRLHHSLSGDAGMRTPSVRCGTPMPAAWLSTGGRRSSRTRPTSG